MLQGLLTHSLFIHSANAGQTRQPNGRGSVVGDVATVTSQELRIMVSPLLERARPCTVKVPPWLWATGRDRVAEKFLQGCVALKRWRWIRPELRWLWSLTHPHDRQVGKRRSRPQLRSVQQHGVALSQSRDRGLPQVPSAVCLLEAPGGSMSSSPLGSGATWNPLPQSTLRPLPLVAQEEPAEKVNQDKRCGDRQGSPPQTFHWTSQSSRTLPEKVRHCITAIHAHPCL